MCGLKLCWVLIGSFTCYFTWHFVKSDGEHRFWCLKIALALCSSGGLPQVTGSIIMYICEWTFKVHSSSVCINCVAQSLYAYIRT